MNILLYTDSDTTDLLLLLPAQIKIFSLMISSAFTKLFTPNLPTISTSGLLLLLPAYCYYYWPTAATTDVLLLPLVHCCYYQPNTSDSTYCCCYYWLTYANKGQVLLLLANWWYYWPTASTSCLLLLLLDYLLLSPAGLDINFKLNLKIDDLLFFQHHSIHSFIYFSENFSCIVQSFLLHGTAVHEQAWSFSVMTRFLQVELKNNLQNKLLKNPTKLFTKNIQHGFLSDMTLCQLI